MLFRSRERKTRDVNQVKCIKDGADQLLVKDEEIKRRWQEYFDNLFTGENVNSTFELDDYSDDTKDVFCDVSRRPSLGRL